MQCDMCGRETGLFRAVIEDSELKVCKECARFGKIIRKIMPAAKQRRKTEEKEEEEVPEIIQAIVPDYPQIVKKARESRGLKQEELAKKINEKESVVHKVETGHYEPNIMLAKKLERFLKIKIVEEQQIEKAKNQRKTASAEGFTIGDIIKLKK